MRKMTRAIFESFWTSDDDQMPTIVNQYREEYKRVDGLLVKQPEILAAVHGDMKTLLERKTGRQREADFTSENLFRAILVMQIEGLPYRDVTIRIAESETLQNFCRLLKRKTIDDTLLCKAFCTIQPTTWEKINKRFAIRMTEEKKIRPENIRTDTTVTECNIHWPTDSSLLWDCYRVLEREIAKVREIAAQTEVDAIRFHVKKIRKLHLDITRFSNSKNKQRKRQVIRWKKTLTKRVEQTVIKVEAITQKLLTSADMTVYAIGMALNEKLPLMARIVNVANRNLQGEKVPVEDKVFSIFEPHTELIMRRRRGKPIEFGHKVLFSECPEKFITDYFVFEQSPSDTTLLPMVFKRHEKTFGKKPKTVSADMGFCPDNDELEALRDEVKYLAVPKRLRDLGDTLLSTYQKFRADIKGTISCLKRAFRLSRSCFRGFKGFCRAVGSAVFCHNLIVIAKQE